MLLAAAACRPNSMGAGDQPDPLNGGAIFEDVIAYTEFGTHRTASRGDLETSSWLADELRSAGFEVDLQRWTLDQFDLDECQVEVGDRVLECFPFWLPASLPEGGLTAELVRVGPESDTEDLDGRIAFMDSETVGAGHFKLGVSERIIDSGAIGSVYVVARDTGEIVAQNAVPPFDKNRLPIPAVIVGQKDEASLLSAADNRDEIRLQVDGWLVEEAEAFNVLGRLERGPWWIVVSTPTSGWFDCGGERGPGVAMWLALAWWASLHHSDTSFLFVATSGHELDYMGAHEFADSRVAPPPDRVVIWLHLGASIGTRLWEQSADGWKPLPARNPGNLVGSPEIVPILKAAFSEVPGLNPRDGESRGELRVVLENGYRAFGFYGGHPWFHTPRDASDSTEPAFLEPVARACAKALVAVERDYAR
jgi:hypothetical protein